MKSNTLICKRCKAPLEYEEGSSVMRCPHCGYTEKIDESDEITRERIRAKTYKETELGKRNIEKEIELGGKQLDLEKEKLGITKTKYIIFTSLAVVAIATIIVLIYVVVTNIQHMGKVHIEQASDYYIGMDYEVTCNLLKEAGFEHIIGRSQETLTMQEKELVGKVIQVAIDGNPTFEDDWFAKDAVVTVYYGALDPKRANDIRIPLSRTDCIGKNYQSIIDQLTTEGFYNIKPVSFPDLSMDLQSQDGKITRITINNSEEFYLGDYFPADSIIQIDYHTMDPERITDVMIPASYDSYVEKDYLSVCKEFITAGFNNITLLPKYDVHFYEGSKVGVTQTVTVDGESTFLKGVWLPYDTEVRVAYHAKEFKYIGEDYQKISDMLSSIGFTNIELKPLDDLKMDELKKSGEVVSVLINEKELSEAGELNLLAQVEIQYHSEQQATDNEIKITATSKDFSGENYKDVVTTLEEMGFTNVKPVALGDLKKGWIHGEGEVKEVSIGGVTKFAVGEVFDKNVEILVSYHSFPE